MRGKKIAVAIVASAALLGSPSGAGRHDAPRARREAVRDGRARDREPAVERRRRASSAGRSTCSTTGITGASIRDAHGMVVAKLGSMYKPKGCATVATKALDADRVEARLATGSGSTRRAIRATCAASCSPAWRTCRTMSDSTTTDETPAGGGTARVGRGVFLAAVAGGVSSLLWGKAAWGRVSGALSPVGVARPARPDGRLADLHRRRARCRSSTRRRWRLADRRPRRAAARRSRYHELLALPKVEQVSTFHCVTGWTVKNVHWGGVRHRATCSRSRARSDGAHALEFVSAEQPVRRLPHARSRPACTT